MRKGAATTDMTKGSTPKLIVRFAAPIFLSYVCQQLYQMADSAVVGRLLGVQAFAGVGATGTFCWMFLCVALGLTHGFGVLFSQRFGAGDYAGLRRTVYNAALLSACIAAVEGTLGILVAGRLLAVVGTPEEIYPYALSYLKWYIAGVPAYMLYNVCASILRAVGDSRTPMLAVIAASVLNIVLDILSVTALGMGVAGVAISTVTAQLCAGLFCLYKVKRTEAAFPTRQDCVLESARLRTLARLGAPQALRDVVIAVGGMLTLPVVNGYGMFFVAGNAAAKKYFGLMEMAGGALEGGIATFVGQNTGAGNHARARAGVAWTAKAALVCSLAIMAIILLFGRTLIRLLVVGAPNEIEQVVEYGYKHLSAMGFFLPPLYMIFVYRSSLQSMGRVLVPMLSGFLEMVCKLATVFLLAGALGMWSVFLAEGFSWAGAGAMVMIAYYCAVRKQKADLRK